MAKNYSYGELMKMQEDAIRRVKEMQKRATMATQETNESINQRNNQGERNVAPQHSPPQTKKQQSQRKQQAQNKQQPPRQQRSPFQLKKQTQNKNTPQRNNQVNKKQGLYENKTTPKGSNQQQTKTNNKNPLFNLLIGDSKGLNGFLGNSEINISDIMEKLDDPEASEQILLLLLLILLSDENADKILLLALLYIMID